MAKIEDAGLAEGDPVFVKYLGADKRGKTRMTMANIDQKTGEEIKKEKPAEPESEPAQTKPEKAE